MQDTSLRGDNLFKEAQRVTRWHYQWVVVNDFLRRIVGDEVVDDIMRPSSKYKAGCPGVAVELQRPRLLFYEPEEAAYMPVEFAVAAYRFGHSMVRPSYFFNDFVRQQTQGAPTPLFSASRGQFDNLNGFRTLPPDWGFEWRFFFDLDPAEPAQRAFKIDTRLAHPLGALPDRKAPPSLAVLNLLRGHHLGLPAGQDVARAMGLEPLSDSDLGLAKRSPAFAGRAPLWYYVLREAELHCDGLRLGPVGGRIVAEVLIGLLKADRLSFLRVEPNWKPTLPAAQPGRFEMADLLRFALT